MHKLKFYTCDKTIRNVLVHQLKKTYQGHSDTSIISEFTLSETGTRADIAVVNGSLHGFELKSDLDTLNRLPSQMQGYNAIFDKITIVVGKKHVVKTIQEIPEWWGIIIAKDIGKKNPILIKVREPLQNQNQNLLAILKLLWKNELIFLLKSENLYSKLSSANKNRLCEIIINKIESQKIKDYVRMYIVNRNRS